MPKRTRKPSAAARLTPRMERMLQAFGRLTVPERRQFANAMAVNAPKPAKFGKRSGPNLTSQLAQIDLNTQRDYFRPSPQPNRYPTEPDGAITPARVTLSVRMRHNPIRGLTFDRMTGYLDQWRLGFFRMAGMAWDAMERRDYQMQIVRPKRLKSVARHGYDVLTVALTDDSQKTLAEQQKVFLKNFYDQATATSALNPDEEGGCSLLIRQMMDCVGKYYSVHEIIYQPQPDGNLTARFLHCPIWWFEGTQGKLRYLPSEFQVYGNDMLPGEWIVTCGDGIMETCSIIYLLKYLPLKSWLAFLDKFGMPGIHGKTDAQKGSKEWNDFVDAVSEFGEEWATVTNRSAEISLVEAAKASGDGGYDKIVELMDRKLTQLWRGADLGTQSNQNGTGASLQQDESEILETDDAMLIEETLAKKVSRHALEWKFGAGCPQLAYIKLRTTPRQNIADDLNVDEFLARFTDDEGNTLLGTQATLERYSRPLPKEDEDTLRTAAPAAATRPPAPENPADDSETDFANEQQTKQDLAATLHELVLPVLKRLEAIAKLEDATMQQHLLEKLLRDFPQIAAALQADDSLAKKLAPVLEHELMTAAQAPEVES